jgi:transposase
MDNQLTLTTERIDDLVLLIHVMLQVQLPDLLDRHLPRHWLQQGLSWGWVTTIWLAHILTQGDHRKLPVREWVAQAHETLESVTGLDIRDTDFTDDRLTIVLRHLSKPDYWHKIETDFAQNAVRVYDLAQKRVRLDATTVSGYHSGGEESLFQLGHSKDDPDLLQVKVMMATLDPLGLPLVTQIVSGEKADDGLYVPIVERVCGVLAASGLLFVGDCKMSALATRAFIHARKHHYLTPLALVGTTAKQIPIWIATARTALQAHRGFAFTDAEQAEALWEQGYEFSRECQASVAGKARVWSERVLMIYSRSYAKTLARGLTERLATAKAKLLALTPAVGRGKRQIVEEAALVKAADAIVGTHHLEGLLTYTFQRQESAQVHYVGRGRGSATRPQQVRTTVRYQITGVQENAEAIETARAEFGWRAFVTDASAEELSLAEAVEVYKDEWLIERGFHRLKGVPLSLNPLFVKRDDQVSGLISLLSLAVRVLTLIEYVVRRGLAATGGSLVGLHLENPKKASQSPTTERLLRAFSKVTLTLVHLPDRVVRHVTQLTPLQVQILELLNLSPDIYRSLAHNSG